MALRPRRYLLSPPYLHGKSKAASAASRAKIERLRAELVELHERIEESQRVRQLADAIPAFIAHINADRKYIFLNQYYKKRFKRPVSELCGRTVAEVLGPENYPSVHPYLEAALRGEQGQVEQRVVLPGGESMFVDAAYVPDRRSDGSITGCFVMAVDITERMQAERLAREGEERLRMAKEAAGLGIHDVDLRTQTARWDPCMRELWGFTADQPITYEDIMAGVHPDDRAAVLAAIARASDPGGDGSYQLEHRVINRVDGRVNWVAATGKTTFEDGRPVRTVGTVQDITARKQAEDALRRSKQELSESARRKDEFLAMLGHELRNPLAAICTASELLHDQGADDPRLARIGEVLERQSKQMVRLVDGLLDITRIARGKIHLEPKLVDLRQVLLGVLDDRGEQLARRGLRLGRRIAERPLWVFGDEVRLAQIFDNLIGNALKFTTAPGSIHVVASSRGPWVTIRVKDTGVGIHTDMLDTIFEPFQQDRLELARNTGGLGIGLALVRGLVELHGGSVIARSEGPGSGAEFEVRLPVSAWGVRSTETPLSS